MSKPPPLDVSSAPALVSVAGAPDESDTVAPVVAEIDDALVVDAAPVSSAWAVSPDPLEPAAGSDGELQAATITRSDHDEEGTRGYVIAAEDTSTARAVVMKSADAR
ncbi:MAG TPA: hypothetical protein VFG69_08715 [Nannocystaceae bacterium]|nr:hypothetical protein [Nannocystaceae bacterium]